MTSPTAANAAPDKLDGTVLKIAAVVVLGAIMSILDITVVSVALPTFQTVFDASYATVAWTMTGYTLALATVIPLTGWAADRFGTKRLYMLALVLFMLGSIACGLAWNIGSLITFRVLQGLGGGMLMPLGMTIMTRAAGPDRIGRVMAVLGVPMLLGPIGGPILGGWLIEVGELALDLLHQPADRHHRADRRVAGAGRRTARRRPRPSTSSACCCCRPVWRCSSTACLSIPGEGTVASATRARPGLRRPGADGRRSCGTRCARITR